MTQVRTLDEAVSTSLYTNPLKFTLVKKYGKYKYYVYLTKELRRVVIQFCIIGVDDIREEICIPTHQALVYPMNH